MKTETTPDKFDYKNSALGLFAIATTIGGCSFGLYIESAEIAVFLLITIFLFWCYVGENQ